MSAPSVHSTSAAPARVDKSYSEPQLVADIDWDRVSGKMENLKREAQGELEGAGAAEVEWTLGADMRYFGQGAEVAVMNAPLDGAALLKQFEESYAKLYGRTVPGARPQVITWRLTGRAQGKGHRFEWAAKKGGVAATKREIYLPPKKAYAEVPVYDRYSVAPGTALQGPLVLEERECTIVAAVKSTVTILEDLTVSVVIEEFD
jgi:N-methylhydantoinase A